jgi:hypothetical protein
MISSAARGAVAARQARVPALRLISGVEALGGPPDRAGGDTPYILYARR